ncbi:hypothetical protein IF2G_08285 [Cordyceps javanica]|nr:hypothetical protein IF2G_08285 [Cordyceps javanica]
MAASSALSMAALSALSMAASSALSMAEAVGALCELIDGCVLCHFLCLYEPMSDRFLDRKCWFDQGIIRVIIRGRINIFPNVQALGIDFRCVEPLIPGLGNSELRNGRSHDQRLIE